MSILAEALSLSHRLEWSPPGLVAADSHSFSPSRSEVCNAISHLPMTFPRELSLEIQCRMRLSSTDQIRREIWCFWKPLIDYDSKHLIFRTVTGQIVQSNQFFLVVNNLMALFQNPFFAFLRSKNFVLDLEDEISGGMSGFGQMESSVYF
jgi:hypothetical protein